MGVLTASGTTAGTTAPAATGLWGGIAVARAPTGTASSVPPNVSNSKFNKALNQILGLENAVKYLKNALDGDKIEVAGQLFESRSQTKAWLHVNVAGTGMFLHFLGSISSDQRRLEYTYFKRRSLEV
mmetsp:Transcript_5656/g.8691  ORF Transcript_5656/g.8691 Transcript_5656/m.8691 type:complete len:127 (-) Transcript_5656:83-463(-)